MTKTSPLAQMLELERILELKGISMLPSQSWNPLPYVWKMDICFLLNTFDDRELTIHRGNQFHFWIDLDIKRSFFIWNLNDPPRSCHLPLVLFLKLIFILI